MKSPEVAVHVPLKTHILFIKPQDMKLLEGNQIV